MIMEKQYSRINKLVESITEKENQYEDEDEKCLDIGTFEFSPTLSSILRVEKSLKVKLPKSYLWFLENYGYISLFSQEVFYISNDKDVDKVPSADIEWNYFLYKEDSFIKDYEIPIFNDEFGQLYLMDSSKIDEDKEYPIYCKFTQNGEDKVYYAKNFLNFLEKQFKDM